MTFDPVQHLIQIAGDGTRGDRGPVDQDHRQAQCPRGQQLGLGPRAARVLGDDMGDPVIAQQRGIARDIKGATRDHQTGIRQGQRALGRIDQSQQVMVLRARGESRDMLATNRQKHPRGGLGQRVDRLRQIRDMGPAILWPGLPRRAFVGQQRHAGFGAGRNGVPAHPGGERVGRIHHASDGMNPQIVHQSGHAAKAADPRGQGLRDGRSRSPGIGKDRIKPARGKRLRQTAGLGRATKNEDARHV